MKSHNDLLSGSERRAKENRNKCRRPSEASYAGFSLARSGEPDTQGITECTGPGQKPASYPPAIPEAPKWRNGNERGGTSICGDAVGASKLVEGHFTGLNPIMTFYQAQSGGPGKTVISAADRAKRAMPYFPWPEAASLILRELRKARDSAKTPQVTPRRFPKRRLN
jgi:hypothetical protein